MTRPRITKQEKKEINDYLDRFEDYSAEKLLKLLDGMKEFAFKYMTPQGREFFEYQRSNGKVQEGIQKSYLK